MKAAKDHERLLELIDHYVTMVDRISDDDFMRTPHNGGWSYAEVYSHIFRVNIQVLQAIEICINNEATEHKGTHWITRPILFFEAFPPALKLKVPKRFEGLTEKISKDEARSEIAEFAITLNCLYPAVDSASRTQKVAHPRLAMLNAHQWLRFCFIHTKHHAKQLDRITAALSKEPNQRYQQMLTNG